MPLIEADKIILDYSGLAQIAPNDFAGTAKYFADQIKAAPTITPESLVRHAKWLEYEGEDAGFHFCSNPKCRKQAFNYEDGREVIEVLSAYCPHCGAKMDLEADHE